MRGKETTIETFLWWQWNVFLPRKEGLFMNMTLLWNGLVSCKWLQVQKAPQRGEMFKSNQEPTPTHDFWLNSSSSPYRIIYYQWRKFLTAALYIFQHIRNFFFKAVWEIEEALKNGSRGREIGEIGEWKSNSEGYEGTDRMKMENDNIIRFLWTRVDSQCPFSKRRGGTEVGGRSREKQVEEVGVVWTLGPWSSFSRPVVWQ